MIMNKSLFSYNIDIRKNAYLNWRTHRNSPTHNLSVLAEGYADGALALIDTVLQDNTDKKADALIWPILFSIDHSIELYIKTILRLIEEQDGSSNSQYKSHDISELLNRLIKTIKKTEKGAPGLEEHLKPVTDYINELCNKIKTKNSKGRDVVHMEFARYPFDIEDIPYFYIKDTGNVTIDMENLRSIFKSINESLDALCSIYEDRFEDYV